MADLSPAARILAEFLEQHPGALGELLLHERLSANEPSPDTPALSAARVLSPWTPDGDESGSVERIELVSGLLVASVLRRELLEPIHRGSLPRTPWIGLLWDYHSGEAPERVAVAAETREAACALADLLLVAEERRWRLM